MTPQATHVIVTYDRTTKSIAAVTPTNDPSVPMSTEQTNYTVWEWDRWFGVRRAETKEKGRK